MFVLYVSGVQSEMILYRCSIATLIVFLLVLLAGIIILMAKSDSDADFELPDGIIGTSSPYRYRRLSGRYYMWDMFFYHDAVYFYDLGKRRDNYVDKNKEFFEEEEKKEIY